MTAPDDATRRQIEAARPDRSTWLSANAGSGKTRVLTDRVARLLLDGVDPQHILCLTYTKAAASEMQNRLFARLGAWAMRGDDALAHDLTELGYEGLRDAEALRRARTLFAQAIETPGGLKIQTIHSFCAALLRRFPMEAGVSPQFREMEDRAARQLRAEIVEDIANGPHASTLYAVARQHAGDSLDELTGEIVRHRGALANPMSDAQIAAMFGQPVGLDRTGVESCAFTGDEAPLLDALVAALRSGSSNDVKAAERLGQIPRLDISALPVLEKVFLTGKDAKEPFSAKIGSFPTKASRAANPGLIPALNALMARVETAREKRIALAAMEKTRVLRDFAGVFLQAYEEAKKLRGLLDFDDLILKARGLLTDSDLAAWVLFRLDGGIDHILVDEAQDTSPAQWQVIERLAQEFTSGTGARADKTRTIFVVGDKKQSIYSFQGADPGAFDRMRADFATRLENSETPLQACQMAHSFRSAQCILTLVDRTFAGDTTAGFTPGSGHVSYRAEMPGRVDLWPPVTPPEKEEEPPWTDPIDVLARNAPPVVLACEIAARIRRLLDERHPIPEGKRNDRSYVMRPVTPGDFLILVRRRSDLFHEIIRECKARDLPVAGADRLKVGAELAVRDLGALLSFLDTPEDDLSLAAALRSPLFGWDEAALYDLAHDRETRFLWEALRRRAAEFPDTMAIIGDLRDHTDYLRPYDLIERILTRHGGRRRLLARLGAEAEDGIDALLTQALAYERQAVDSLTGFLVWMQTDEFEIKRQMDSAGDRIRVMTVHGAKGLESPIVILPDTAQWPLRIRDQILPVDGHALWRTPADDSPSAVRDAVEGLKAAQEAERTRLLYVAMTRAEKWLIVAAAGDLGKDGTSWYEKVKRGMTACGAYTKDFGLGPGLRLQTGNWNIAPPAAEAGPPDEPPHLPDFFSQPAPTPLHPPEVLSPSELGGAKALPGEEGQDEAAAKAKGTRVHLLLEHLPQLPRDDWPDAAERLLCQGVDPATPEACAEALAEARYVLTRPGLAHLFAHDALAEVPVSAKVDALQGRRIHGVLDRLLVCRDRVLAVDFKTNAIVPGSPRETPEGLLRQMGAYAQALGKVYPDRRVETALLWTRTATLMPLPHDVVTAALARVPPA
ncbi:double-strand break repair helicase AddA [Roseovarius salinarum]|uniref:double-strand break repair helicase AddA n=1 Tax=Roseovarius salinarum TaxID=1981892 RepID=UPI000C32C0F1|nr:double-strand break repair helicase AddA [Roseovarius salinarum]